VKNQRQKRERDKQSMSGKRRKKSKSTDNNRFSLMYTLNSMSRLNKEEFELLKKIKHESSLKKSVKESELHLHPKIQKILDEFNVGSIEEVIQIVENFRLFELYDFSR
jgi:hypothetical protein